MPEPFSQGESGQNWNGYMASRCIGASFNSEQLLILQNVLDEVCGELELNDDLSRAVKELD